MKPTYQPMNYEVLPPEEFSLSSNPRPERVRELYSRFYCSPDLEQNAELRILLRSSPTPNYLLDSGASITAIDLQTAQACRIRLGDPQSVEGKAGASLAYLLSHFQATVCDTLLPKSIMAFHLGPINKRRHRH